MERLPLDDPRWKELEHRGGNTPFVPDELAKLAANPEDLKRFNELWPFLCSEGRPWQAAYAAVPYFVELAKQVAPDRRFDYLCFVGLVVVDSSIADGEEGAVKPYLLKGYRQALVEALPLLAETLIAPHDAMQTRYLLAASAALKGHPKLGGVLANMDCVYGVCPNCGEEVFPKELQDALG